MINYHRSAFGLNLLFRLHGSAVYRSFLPALIAVLVFLILRFVVNDSQQPEEQTLDHPYVIGVVVGGITFLIVFRATSSYGRYWEACSSVYQMQSKWMDATIHTACYHMQCHHYDSIKPPSYVDYPEFNAQFLTRDRERVRPTVSLRSKQGVMHSQRALERSINTVTNTSKLGDDNNGGTPTNSKGSLRKPKPKQQAHNLFETAAAVQERRKLQSRNSSSNFNPKNIDSNRSEDGYAPNFLSGVGRLDGNWGPLFKDGKSTFVDPQKLYQRPAMGFASHQGGRTPPVFLQELAHLASLMTAVALSTLRNDIDGSESPLDFYHIGSPWPKVDPEDMPELYQTKSQKFWANVKYFFGVARTPEERTRYNAARPLSVLGGVSDNEIAFLQMARGPYAKTQLCWNWLSEFVTREHLAGSLGKVGPPIISRIIQFLGDGMVSYNHARKIMFIPFPFPHAQLSAAYVLVMIPMIPYMMDQYVYFAWVGCLLTFLSVACLSAIHEVARELENPFRNVPNELPVCTMMAEFNEALVTMYAGYHPDFFWEVPEEDAKNVSTTKDSLAEESLLNQLNAGSGPLQRWSERDAEETSHSENDDKEEATTHPLSNDIGAPENNKRHNPNATTLLTDESAQTDAPTTSIATTSMNATTGTNRSSTADTTLETSCGLSTEKVATKEPTLAATNPAPAPLPLQNEVAQLRTIVQQQERMVQQQGRMMDQMLQENAQLNKLIQAMLLQGQQIQNQQGTAPLVDTASTGSA